MDLEFKYPDKPKAELNSSLLVFKLLNNPLIVNISSKATLLALKIGLPISFAIKHTIFKHFCGGETLQESVKVIEKLGKDKICSTLDYSAESVDSTKFFDKTKKEILKAIDFVKDNAFVKSLAVKPTGLASSGLLMKKSNLDELTANESDQYSSAIGRIDQICNAGHEHGIDIYIDAEESTIQKALDDISIDMMKKYNQEKAVVYITLQMYRKDRLAFLEELIGMAIRDQYYLGVKLVRGAYWEKERKRDSRNKERDIVFLKKEDTDSAFNRAIDVCMENLDALHICNATHNEESSRHLASAMSKKNIPNDYHAIQFSQLYGMSDHISYSLAKAGYNVSKYLPYGAVKQVIPYLIRRAEENKAISGQMSREAYLINQAIKSKNE
ncbi:MAG TPA: PutA protein [Flavobacteriales bacterium]|nr:PutA protein [Flavobacteriales bacterium]HIN39917.1 PutA protein [Flavobacteriales bacterium]